MGQGISRTNVAPALRKLTAQGTGNNKGESQVLLNSETGHKKEQNKRRGRENVTRELKHRGKGRGRSAYQ